MGMSKNNQVFANYNTIQTSDNIVNVDLSTSITMSM